MRVFIFVREWFCLMERQADINRCKRLLTIFVYNLVRRDGLVMVGFYHLQRHVGKIIDPPPSEVYLHPLIHQIYGCKVLKSVILPYLGI